MMVVQLGQEPEEAGRGRRVRVLNSAGGSGAPTLHVARRQGGLLCDAILNSRSDHHAVWTANALPGAAARPPRTSACARCAARRGALLLIVRARAQAMTPTNTSANENLPPANAAVRATACDPIPPACPPMPPPRRDAADVYALRIRWQCERRTTYRTRY